VKCSEVHLGEVQMGKSEVSTSVLKWSEGLRSRVYITIRRYTWYRSSEVCCFFHILLVLFCITGYMVVCFVCFYLILYIMYSYCYVCSVLDILLLCVVLCIDFV